MFRGTTGFTAWAVPGGIPADAPTPERRSVLTYAGRSAWDTVLAWRQRSRERKRDRRAAALLAPNELRDLGVTREFLLTAAGKPFWRA